MKPFSFLTGAAVVLAAVAMTAHAQTNIVSVKLDDETRNMLREAIQDRWFKKGAFMTNRTGLRHQNNGEIAACTLSQPSHAMNSES